MKRKKPSVNKAALTVDEQQQSSTQCKINSPPSVGSKDLATISVIFSVY